MRKQKNVFIDLSDLPKYEKGDQKTTEKRRQEYQKKYQTEYQKTSKKIQIRVSETEYEHLSEVAQKNGMPLSRFIMMHFNHSYKKSELKDSNYKQLMTALTRIGTNINQMAYQLNSTKIKMISKSGLKYLDQVRSELQRIAKYAKS